MRKRKEKKRTRDGANEYKKGEKEDEGWCKEGHERRKGHEDMKEENWDEGW